jgi:Lrp/AsnC family leucine-responsive transcriptional regulator
LSYLIEMVADEPFSPGRRVARVRAVAESVDPVQLTPVSCRNRPRPAGVRRCPAGAARPRGCGRVRACGHPAAHTHHVTGNYDYLLQVEVADLAAYEDFHANRLASLPGVAMMTSYVTMKTVSADTARRDR